jgi:hypothetical protein
MTIWPCSTGNDSHLSQWLKSDDSIRCVPGREPTIITHTSNAYVVVTLGLLCLNRHDRVTPGVLGAIQLFFLLPIIVLCQAYTGGANSPFNIPPIGTLQVCTGPVVWAMPLPLCPVKAHASLQPTL